MGKAPEPLEVDSTEAERIHQAKNVVHGSVQTSKVMVSCSELSQEIIEVPIKSVLLPDSVFDVKVEEMHKTMADSHNPEHTDPSPLVSPVRKKNASIASGRDLERKDNAGVACQSNQPEVDIDAKESTCTVPVTTEDKGKGLSHDIVYDEKVEDSNSLASIEDCLALFFKEEVIELRCEKCSKDPEQPSNTGSKDGGQMVASTDENISVDEDQNEQKYRTEHADQKVIISELPPVLTVQLVRFGPGKDNSDEQVKISGHVIFEEHLDVGRFTDLRSEDKDNARYRLVGVIEHIGSSVKVGHYVAYVRASRIGSDQQSSSGSSTWFRANDEKIKAVSLEEVRKREAYVLFYERMEGTVSNSSE
uniref:USP domain-containing protein n=1 Tax=Arundo donax TaxID=35708 RepID=A0A0A9B8U8_ARUDO